MLLRPAVTLAPRNRPFSRAFRLAAPLLRTPLEGDPLGAEHEIPAVENLGNDVDAIPDIEIHEMGAAVFELVQ